MLGQLLVEGLEPPTGATDPVRQGRAVQLDALPGEDLALPVKRKMIAVLGDQEMGEQGGGRQALGDRPLPEQEPDGWSRRRGSRSGAGRCG